jgi:hypothetical protein
MNKWKSVFSWLGSIQLTLFCLGMMMLLIFFGTIAQAKIGTFAAQREYFNQFFVWSTIHGARLPLLPGGLSVGTLWFVNLVAAFVMRFRFEKKSAGILVSHFGLILLLAGQGLTQLLAVESQLPIQEGSTANYSESTFETELAITMTSDPAFDEVVSIPYDRFSEPGTIRTPALPFDVRIVRFFRNADLSMSQGATPATQGVGTRIAVRDLPPTYADNERNANTAYVELLDGEKSLGTWLVSLALGAPQSVSVGGKDYRLTIRPRRIYYPFAVTLKKFRHDIYKGTEIPKNFSSLVRLENKATGESRDALIYMNHPLRYAGNTFYQASFAENDTVSIFQVVRNPAWLTPYVGCLLVALGLAIQFATHLVGFVEDRRNLP